MAATRSRTSLASALIAAAAFSSVALLLYSQAATEYGQAARLGADSLLRYGRRLKGTTRYDTLPGQISFQAQTFPEFLSQYPKEDLIWLTLANEFYSKTCTVQLQRFVSSLPPYPLRNGSSRQHRLVTLCMDEGCMEQCRTQGWTCYGEYEATRPEVIFPSTWPKLAGLIDTLSTGRDLVFVDSDVFFRS